jgi:hypothetical protein
LSSPKSLRSRRKSSVASHDAADDDGFGDDFDDFEDGDDDADFGDFDDGFQEPETPAAPPAPSSAPAVQPLSFVRGLSCRTFCFKFRDPC